MRKQALSSVLVTALAGASAFLAPSSLQETAQHAHETPLEEHMESIEDAVKRLRRSLRDPANLAGSLELVARMQADTLVCKGLEPRLSAGLPADERAASATAYRRLMVDFLSAQLELEAALLDGDAEATSAAFQRVRDFEEPGHERFTEQEE